MEKSKVYFSKEITPEKVVEIFKKLNVELGEKVAVKLHSGEKGNQNYIRPEFVKPIIDLVNGTVVECNTAYSGARNSTEKHKQLMKEHKWTDYFDVDIMDGDGEITFEIPNGKVIKENYVGKNITNYDSMLVLSHFKGHPMGGYGGALKQLSIGCASSSGKAWIHSGGFTNDQTKVWKNHAEQNKFLEAMAESASSVMNYFKNKIAFVNIMCNMSVDCDCCAVAEDPCMKDIGILASTDPVAIDQACLDLVYSSNDKGKDHLIQRIESRNGVHTIESAFEIGVGNRKYELIDID
ncbi:MAG: DUF362 domain-containing protein [Clostridia bacterium]|nr:DUF362 domain-containing protein [Clostridia bacterium]